MAQSWINLRRLAWALPVVFVLHVAEEAPGFVTWFNAHVEPDINGRTFLTVITTGLVITVLVAAPLAVSRGRAAAILASAWVGFAMLANGIFHVAAAIVDRGYAPGVATAILLYVPVSLLLIRAISKECRMSRSAVATVMLFAGIPMFAHGWLILFRGSRLF